METILIKHCLTSGSSVFLGSSYILINTFLLIYVSPPGCSLPVTFWHLSPSVNTWRLLDSVYLLGYGFHLKDSALSHIRYWLVVLTSFVPLIHQHIFQASHSYEMKGFNLSYHLALSFGNMHNRFLY